MWSEHCSYKSSRVHSEDAADRRPAGAAGARRERRRRGHRRRPRRRLQDRVAQPPVVHRAVPGRGDRRRRHHPRHLHDGRATDCAAELACASDRSMSPARVAFSRAWSPGIAEYGNSIGIPDGRRRDRVRAVSMLATRWSTCSASASRRHPTSSRASRPGVGNAVTTSARRPDATASTARRWRRRSSTRSRRRSGPAVQVGDPFMEKLLLEACLEVMQTDALRRHSGHGRRPV